MAMFNVVAYLATPVTGSVARAPGLDSTILNGDMDFLNLVGGEVGGLAKSTSYMIKDVLRGISGSKVIRTAIKSLSFYL